MTYADIQAKALAVGITALRGRDFAEYEALSDGCSGGLSRLYALGGRTISCHNCCVVHDWLYGYGGTRADRKKADTLLYWCAANSGDFSGRRGPFLRAWRRARAWAMYAAVRAWGWRGTYWAGE